MRIRDDDVPVLSVLDADPVPDVGGQSVPMDFTVQLEDLNGNVISARDTVRVRYATDPATDPTSATEGPACSVDGTGYTDYAAASGELVFAPGDTTKTVTVIVCPDTRNEPDEQVRLVLLRTPEPVGAVLGVDVGIGIISGTRTIYIDNHGIREQNGSLSVPVRLSEVVFAMTR